MTINLLTEQYLEFLSLKGGCTGSSESTCVGNHVAAQIIKPQHAELHCNSHTNEFLFFQCAANMEVRSKKYNTLIST